MERKKQMEKRHNVRKKLIIFAVAKQVVSSLLMKIIQFLRDSWKSFPY